MRLPRLLRHGFATQWRTRMRFPPACLDAIELAVRRAEVSHQGEIRFVIETALAPWQVLKDVSPHERALEVFSHLRVWDTERNNGVLIYVQLADRHVEIVADRGFRGAVSPEQWAAVCRQMEQHFGAGRFEAGAVAGVAAVGALIAAHFPATAAADADADGSGPANELPDRPALI